MKGKFLVEFNNKRRDYEVSLECKFLHLKPCDPTSGRRIELKGNRILFCKHLEDENSNEGRFKLTYCCNPDTLACRTYTFSVQEFENGGGETKSSVADKWLEQILQLYNIPRKYRSRKILLVVNPKAGKGQAVSVHRSVKKIFDDIGLEYEVLITEKTGHAKQFIKEETNINQWGSVLVLSGDGGIHEVINGIFGRQDWKYILNTIAIGVLPVGSGNALVGTLRYLQNDTRTGTGYFSSLTNTICGRPFPIDLFSVSLKGGEQRLGFLSLGWGIIADLDIESEPLRFMGEARFTFWALHRITNLRKYKGRLSYVTDGQDQSNFRYADDDDDDDPQRTPDDIEVEHAKIPDTFDEDIDKGWTTVEDEFICVYVLNLSHIDMKTNLAPQCKPNDGQLWLFIIHKEATKADLLKFMTSLENGTHLKLNHVDMIKVKAVRLEPLDKEKKGILTIDGEIIKTDGVQVSILPSAARVMVKQ